MELKHAALLYCLKQRFDRCYDDYIKELMDLDAEQLIEMASEIIAMKEVHFEMCFWIGLSMSNSDWPWTNGVIKKPLAEQDVTMLLSLNDPLREIGFKWWFYTLGNKVDFHDFYEIRDAIQL